MSRGRFVLLPLAIAVLAIVPASASARPPVLAGSKPMEIGHVGVATSAAGLASILVPVRYPIEFAGRLVEINVRLFDPRRSTDRSWTLHEVASAGARRAPERRRGFTFVHRLGLNEALSSRLRDGLMVHVQVPGGLDVNGDG